MGKFLTTGALWATAGSLIALSLSLTVHAVENQPVLSLSDAKTIDTVTGPLGVVSPKSAINHMQNHAYITRHDERFWAMWSAGPPVEDEPGQRVLFARSADGLQWDEPRELASPGPHPYGLIARGYLSHHGKLYALVARFSNKGAFGVAPPNSTVQPKLLEMRRYEFEATEDAWRDAGVFYPGVITNFPPRLHEGQYWMATRDVGRKVAILTADGALQSFREVGQPAHQYTLAYAPDEPQIKFQSGAPELLIRNNGVDRKIFVSRYLGGDQWSEPRASDFPSSSSKFFYLDLQQKGAIIAGNFEPAIDRKLMHFAYADDGVVFDRRVALHIPWQVYGPNIHSPMYPHAVEHAGRIYLVYSIDKRVIHSRVVEISEIKQPENAAIPHLQNAYIRAVCSRGWRIC